MLTKTVHRGHECLVPTGGAAGLGEIKSSTGPHSTHGALNPGPRDSKIWLETASTPGALSVCQAVGHPGLTVTCRHPTCT